MEELRNKIDNAIVIVGSIILSCVIVGFLVYIGRYVYVHVNDIGEFIRICYFTFSALFIWQAFEFIRPVCDIVEDISMLLAMIVCVLLIILLLLYYTLGISVSTILISVMVLLGIIDALYLSFLALSIYVCIDSVKEIEYIQTGREFDSIRRELKGMSLFNLIVYYEIRQQKKQLEKN